MILIYDSKLINNLNKRKLLRNVQCNENDTEILDK